MDKKNLETFEKMVELLKANDLTEVSFESEDFSYKIKSEKTVVASAAPVASAPAASAAATPSADAKPAAAPSDVHVITSPMVGTFYGAPSPESPNFVNVGDKIAAGQTLCIIEAMKLMNELESDVSGTVVSILVENGQAIEFGTPIFHVKK